MGKHNFLYLEKLRSPAFSLKKRGQMNKILFILLLGISVTFANDFTPALHITYDSISSSKYTEATFKFVDAPNHPTGFKATGDFIEKGFIKIRGNSTATAPKKPFNIKFEKKKFFKPPIHTPILNNKAQIFYNLVNQD